MAVNTINQLIDLLNQVDVDATVLAAIANDSSSSIVNGPGPGLVTTRLGSNVKNVQKVIADIENNIVSGIRTSVQDEGTTVVDGASFINFVGTSITVTNVGGVATVTVAGDVSKAGTPVDNQVGVWTSGSTLGGASNFTFDGSTMVVQADAGPRIEINDTNDAVTFYQQIINPGTPVMLMGTSTAHSMRLLTGGLARLSIGAAGNIGINTTDTSLATLTINDTDPDILLTEIAGGGRAAIALTSEVLNIDVDPGNLIATSAIAFNVDAVEQARINDSGNLVMTGDGFVQTTEQVNPQIGLMYTLALTDTNAIVTMSNVSANTLTINPVATTAYPLGHVTEIIQLGAGATTLTAGAGVTLNGVAAGSGTITARYDVIKIRHVASDVWIVDGDIGAIA